MDSCENNFIPNERNLDGHQFYFLARQVFNEPVIFLSMEPYSN